MSACAQWHVYMHVCICVRMYAVLVCNMLYVYVGHTTGRKCIARCHNDISSTSERAFPVFFWRFFGVLNSLQKDVFEYTRINSLLVNGVVTASSHALWRVLSNKLLRAQDGRRSKDFLVLYQQTHKQKNKVMWAFCHCWVDTPHIHIFEGDSVYTSCLLPTATVMPSDSNYVNRSASFKSFCWIIFTVNKLVDRIRNFKSNASQNNQEEDLWWKTCAAGYIFHGKTDF